MAESSGYKLYAFDTEDDGRGGFVLGAVTDGESIWYFKSADTMRVWIESCPDRMARFVAHNLEYDLGNLYRGNYDRLKPKWNRSRLLWSEANGMKARYFNSFCHAPVSLAEIGRVIGLRKKEIAYHKMRTLASSTVKTYLSRDVEILWRFMDRLQRWYLSLGGRLAPTAPGSAMALFRAWTPDYCAKRLDLKFIDAMKPAYYGGRTEAFYRGRYAKRFHYSDVHSMYPWAMKGDFPNFHIWTAKAPREGETGVVDATVRVQFETMPGLPYRGERLLFPEGRFRGTWTRDELDASGAAIEKIHGGVTFPVSAGPVLAGYVQRLYALRQKAETELEKFLCKLLMNSLYGKFASSPTLWTLISEDEYIDRYAAGDCACSARKVWDGSVYLVQEASDGYPVHTNYIWPALITSRARRRLRDDAIAVQSRGGKVMYCDTDSLIYTGAYSLGDAPEMGAWGTKTHLPPEDIDIRGPKMYRIGETYHVKGVPAHGLDERGNETRPAKEYMEKGRTVFRRPVRLREALRRQQAKKPTTPDEWGIPNYWIDVEKVYNENGFAKRSWLKDGWSEPVAVKS